MSNFTLDDLKAELEREYAPFTLTIGDEDFVLPSLMRLERETRKAAVRKLKSLQALNDSDEDADEDEIMDGIRYVLQRIVRDDKGERLADLLGNDVMVAMKVLAKWTEVTQPGEATDSPNS